MTVKTPSVGGGADKTDENPFGVDAADPLAVVIFNGGYGDEYAKFHEGLYSDQFAEAEIDHKAITDIRQQMQPLFNAGTPPDVLDNAGAEKMPISTLADSGQLTDLTELFDAAAIGTEGATVRDTLNPVAIESAEYADKPMVLNYALQVYGLWYDRKLFDEKGWEPAETWDGLLGRSAKRSRVQGMAPDGLPGQVPLLHPAGADGPGRQARRPRGRLRDRLARAGRVEARVDDDGGRGAAGDQSPRATSWRAPRASTTSSRRPAGTSTRRPSSPVVRGWRTSRRASRLRASRRPSRRHRCWTAPSLPFDCTRVEAAEAFIVPAEAANQAGGMEYLRIMLSKEGAAEFTKLTAAPTVVDGATEGLELTPGRRRRRSR